MCGVRIIPNETGGALMKKLFAVVEMPGVRIHLESLTASQAAFCCAAMNDSPKVSIATIVSMEALPRWMEDRQCLLICPLQPEVPEAASPRKCQSCSGTHGQEIPGQPARPATGLSLLPLYAVAGAGAIAEWLLPFALPF
jgi:hypothetical protein